VHYIVQDKPLKSRIGISFDHEPIWLQSKKASNLSAQFLYVALAALDLEPWAVKHAHRVTSKTNGEGNAILLLRRFVERAQRRFRNAVEDAQQRLEHRICRGFVALPGADRRYRNAQLLGELRRRQAKLAPHVARFQQRHQRLVRGARSGSSSIIRSISASVKLSNFSLSKRAAVGLRLF
jgi:hypothetical protein